MIRTLNPITVRFPSGVFINWYDWTVDGNRIYDDYVAKTYKGVPDSTYIKMINNNLGAKTGFPGLTALNAEKKQASGSGYDMLWGYNLNYDDNKKSVARLRDSEAKGFEVNYIEMGNEQFYGNQRSNRTSTPQKYVAVAKSLSDTLHRIKPGIKVSVPLAWRTQQSYIDYNKALTADTTYFDAVTIHKYVGSDPDIPASFTYKDVLAGRLLLEKDVNYARQFAKTKPVWLTEWGVSAGSECQAAAALGMADCYLFLFENQKIYGRADWYCVNGLLNSFVTFVGTSRTIKYPLEKTGYGSVHEILRSVFENSTLIKGNMSTTKISTSIGSTNAVSARMVEKDGKKMVLAVNLTNKPVVFTIQFDRMPINQNFTQEALAFNTLSEDKVMGINENPLELIKEGSGTITLPALSVNKITLNGEAVPIENAINFITPVKDEIIELGSDLVVKAEAGSAVTKVDLFMNDTLVRTISSAPYEWGIDTLVDIALSNLEEGTYTLKLVATNTSLTTTEQLITVECKSTLTQWPYFGTNSVPGKIEIEDYDMGGEGFSYHDSDGNNQTLLYRNDGVDIGSGGSGFVVGYSAGGEWLEYTIDVTEDGMYDFIVFYSSGRAGGGAKIGAEFYDEGRILTASFSLDQTASWSDYVEQSLGVFEFTKGKHVLRINVVDRGFNLDWMEFKRVEGNATYNVMEQQINV